MTFIYALIDPRTSEVRYIGKANNPFNRLFGSLGHLQDKNNTHKTNWIKSLTVNNLKPTLCILEQCEKSIWQEREIDWIAFGRRLAWPLTNLTDGGEGNNGQKCSEETRLKISKALKGRKLSDESRKKMSETAKGKTGIWNKGRKKSKETRLKMSIGQTGKKIPIEIRNKISEKLKGHIPCNKGKNISEEIRVKISNACKGRTPWNKGLKLKERV